VRGGFTSLDRQPHRKAEDFQRQVSVLHEPLAVLGVLGGNQCFAQPIEVSLDPLAQDETVVAREPTRVVAGSENQVVCLGDHDQFLVFFH
jgi:hypothetical protein